VCPSPSVTVLGVCASVHVSRETWPLGSSWRTRRPALVVFVTRRGAVGGPDPERFSPRVPVHAPFAPGPVHEPHQRAIRPECARRDVAERVGLPHRVAEGVVLPAPLVAQGVFLGDFATEPVPRVRRGVPRRVHHPLDEAQCIAPVLRDPAASVLHAGEEASRIVGDAPVEHEARHADVGFCRGARFVLHTLASPRRRRSVGVFAPGAHTPALGVGLGPLESKGESAFVALLDHHPAFVGVRQGVAERVHRRSQHPGLVVAILHERLAVEIHPFDTRPRGALRPAHVELAVRAVANAAQQAGLVAKQNGILRRVSHRDEGEAFVLRILADTLVAAALSVPGAQLVAAAGAHERIAVLSVPVLRVQREERVLLGAPVGEAEQEARVGLFHEVGQGVSPARPQTVHVGLATAVIALPDEGNRARQLEVHRFGDQLAGHHVHGVAGEEADDLAAPRAFGGAGQRVQLAGHPLGADGLCRGGGEVHGFGAADEHGGAHGHGEAHAGGQVDGVVAAHHDGAESALG
jgi:hypothetical protein